jgi:hypothetical protein
MEDPIKSPVMSLMNRRMPYFHTMVEQAPYDCVPSGDFIYARVYIGELTTSFIPISFPMKIGEFAFDSTKFRSQTLDVLR